MIGGRYDLNPVCENCQRCVKDKYPGSILVCYHTEEHPDVAIVVKPDQRGCRRFRGRRDD
jgi:hypothetical protein